MRLKIITLLIFMFLLSNFYLYPLDSSRDLISDLTGSNLKKAVVAADEILSHPTEYSLNLVQLAIGVSGEIGDERVVEHLDRILNKKFPRKKLYERLGIEDTTENVYKIWAQNVENLLCNYPEEVLNELNKEYRENLEMICKHGIRVDELIEKETFYDNTTRALCIKALSELYSRVNAQGIKNKIIDALVEAMLKKENDEVVRASSAEMLGNTFSPMAYESLKEIVNDEQENPVVRLAASRSLTQITEMNPQLTGGNTNYVTETIKQNAINHLINEIFGLNY